MEYDCQIVSAQSLLVDYNKVLPPLCSTCVNNGCSNPIVDHKVSVVGKIHTSRLYKVGGHYFQVMQCEGYRGEIDEDEEII